MARRAIFTRPGRRSVDSGAMDVLAIALGLVVFAAILGLLEALDRI
jgi:hypothetical protein